MIFAEQKPLEEARRMIARYEKVLILGCGTCMTVCDAGGEREVSFLRTALSVAETTNGNETHTFLEHTVKRQCDSGFLGSLEDKVRDVDAVLSLGCGIGVQTVAERFSNVPVLPGVNTTFMGAASEWGVWDERCSACGDCLLAATAGICPISRCTKGILNGPCAGTKNGKCEANKVMDCAWILIYRRLEELGQLENMRRYYPARNFRITPRPRRVVKKASIEVGGGDG